MKGLAAQEDAASSNSDSSNMVPAPGGVGGGGGPPPPSFEAEDDLSPEDAAWVDSCLVKDGNLDNNLSDDAWTAFTEAFITALASASASAATAAADGDGDDARSASIQGDVDKVVVVDSSSSSSSTFADRDSSSSGDGSSMSQSAAADGSQADTFMAEASSPTASGGYAAAFADRQPSPTLGGHSGSPTTSGTAADPFNRSDAEERLDAAAVVIGNEYPEERGLGDAEDDDEFPIIINAVAGEEVELRRDIFRVWELNVRAVGEDEEEEEEDEEEFGRQLKKALEERSSSSSSSSSGSHDLALPFAEDHGEANLDELEMDEFRPSPEHLDDPTTLEELIAGVTHMSLRPPSSSSSS